MEITLRERYFEALSTAPPMCSDNRWPQSIFEPKTPEYENWEKETWQEVKITPIIEHPGIDDEAPLRRFMDLPKLLDLLVNRRLLLPRLAELKKCDPHECNARPDYSQIPRQELERRIIELERYIPEGERKRRNYYPNGLAALLSREKTIHEKIQEMSMEELIQAAWVVEHSRLNCDLVCGCWYGSEMESDAMWRLYCEQVGVAITTTVSRLQAAVSCFVPKVLSNHFKLILAKVTYNDDASCCSGTPPWLIKRKAFRHEDELRLYVDYPLVTAPGFDLHVDPRRLIEKIIVTPYAQKWQAEAIEATVERLISGSPRKGLSRFARGPEVERSTHMDASDPKWPCSSELTGLAGLQNT